MKRTEEIAERLPENAQRELKSGEKYETIMFSGLAMAVIATGVKHSTNNKGLN
jgi:hypothetical protein